MKLSKALWFGAVLLLLAGCDEPFDINGDPELEIGTGEFAFVRVTDGQELTMVRGLQGGYHVWLGARMLNMNPNDMRIDLTMTYVTEAPAEGTGEGSGSGEGTGEPLPAGEAIGNPLFFSANFFPGDSGGFEYGGLPAQLRPDDVRGQLIRLTVRVTDEDNRVAEDSMDIIPID